MNTIQIPNTRRKLLLQVIYWGITFAAWFIFLNSFSRYHFFYIEQAQLFTGEINTHISGWLAQYLTGSYVQHFAVPLVGPIILAFINTFIAGLTFVVLNRLGMKGNGMILAQFVPVCLTFMFFNHLYNLEGTTAFLLALLALVGTISVKPWIARFITAAILAPLLQWFAGPVALLYAVAFFLFGLFREAGWGRITALLPLATASGAAYYAAITGMTDAMSLAFLPDEYFHHNAQPDKLIYAAWWVLWGLILLGGWMGKREIQSAKLRILSFAVSLLLVLGIAWQGTLRYGNAHTTLLKQITYYAQREDWQKVLDLTKDNRTNYLYISYRNLALSHLGTLADDLFHYPQVGLLGLLPTWDKSPTTSSLLSDIYYHIGDIALAQQMAFEGNMAQGNGGCPHLWKRFVETNLIFDAPKIALKYIDLLAKAPHHRAWAEQQRELALHPERIADDPELSAKRRFFGGEQHLRHFYGIDFDIRLIAEHCPESHAAVEYLGCLFLLGKDLQGFQALLDKYYGTPVLPELPVSFQQAVVIINEKAPDNWAKYHITPEVAKQFDAFRTTFNRNRQSAALRSTLLRYFGDTYWYYFTFKK